MNSILLSLAGIMLIIAITAIANYRQNKCRESYDEYLLQLDEVKKRKKARKGPQVGTFRKNDDRVWLDL